MRFENSSQVVQSWGGFREPSSGDKSPLVFRYIEMLTRRHRFLHTPITMFPRRLDLTFWALALIGIGWVVLVEAAAWMDDGPPNAIPFGVVFGTMFGHTAIAAAWVALGPGPLVLRLPLSLLWSLAQVLGICLPMISQPGASPFVFIGIMIGGLWLALQIPFWAIGLGFRLRLRQLSSEANNVQSQAGSRDAQFGIRQLMILTAIVAVMLGLLRLFLPGDNLFELDSEFISVVVLLILSQMLIIVPLVLSACLPLPRHAAIGIGIGVLATIGVTPLEFQIFEQLISSGGGPDWIHFASFNAITALWMIAWGVMVRWSGYRLLRAASPWNARAGEPRAQEQAQ